MQMFIPDTWYTILPSAVELAYLVAIVLFIVGLKRLSSPATARSGNRLASYGMLLGVVVTLLDRDIISFEAIIAGVVVGALIGGLLAKKVEMTSMPELVALFNGFGGIASALVALGTWFRVNGAVLEAAELLTMGLGVLIGGVTFTGSLMAFGKLKGLIRGNAVVFPLQNAVNILLLVIALLATGWLVAQPTELAAVLLITGLAMVLGVLFVLRIGGADMPVVISLLNSLSGIAASFVGFVIDNTLLIVSGALVGAAGLILTNIMCVSMNRTLASVLFGRFGGAGTLAAGAGSGDKTVREVQSTDVAVMTAYARRVVVVPGYGLAVAQAQHVIREVADLLQNKGVDVRYGIHPVAGRMPGHMNVLLAEANVPYSQLYDMEEINQEFEKTDVVLVIGANDVVNPQAKTNPGSPIYGMPVLNVEQASRVVVFKRSMKPGYAGIENDLFYNENTYMYFGNAKGTLEELVRAIKEL